MNCSVESSSQASGSSRQASGRKTKTAILHLLGLPPYVQELSQLFPLIRSLSFMHFNNCHQVTIRELHGEQQ